VHILFETATTRGVRPLDDKRVDQRPEELGGEGERVDTGKGLDVDYAGVGEAENLNAEVSGLKATRRPVRGQIKGVRCGEDVRC
jgi:hypothetical protein